MDRDGGASGPWGRAWRIVGTGISFALFGALGLALSLVVLPIAARGAGSDRVRELRCQLWVQRTFRFFVRVMVGLRVLSHEVRGAERLRQPGQLVVANHPTLLDAVFLVSLMPQADCVVKRAAWRNPFMRGVVRATGYLPNDGGPELVDACVQRLRDGRSLLIFPEGTRSPRGDLGPFRRGAFHSALAAGIPLRPVVIDCQPPSLMRGQKWYDVPDRKMHFTIECCEAMELSDVQGTGDSRGVAARRAAAGLRDIYRKKLQNLYS